MEDAPVPAPRRRVLKGARIVFNNGHSTLDATVRDISETGARATLVNTLNVPDAVVLVLDDGQSFECRVVRRQVTELGLLFIKTPG